MQEFCNGQKRRMSQRRRKGDKNTPRGRPNTVVNDVFVNDFVIRYDPIRQVLSIRSVRSKALLPIQLRLATLKDMGLSGGAKWIGQLFLFFVPELCANFLSETKAARPPLEFIDELIGAFAQQESKSADDLFQLATLYLVRSRFSSSEDDLLRADSVLREAAKAGSQVASETLASDWNEVISARHKTAPRIRKSKILKPRKKKLSASKV